MDTAAYLMMASARTFGFMVSMPFGDAVSTMPRLFVSVILGSALTDGAGSMAEGGGMLVGREVAIGYILGYPFRFVTDVADLMGELLDAARGQTIASIMDPLNGPTASDLATIVRIAACALALHLGALSSGCRVLQLSYEVLPPSLCFDLLEISKRALANSGAFVGALLSAFISFVASFLAIDIIAAISARVCSHISFATVAQATKLLVLVGLGVLSMACWREEILSFFVGHVFTLSALSPDQG